MFAFLILHYAHQVVCKKVEIHNYVSNKAASICYMFGVDTWEHASTYVWYNSTQMWHSF